MLRSWWLWVWWLQQRPSLCVYVPECMYQTKDTKQWWWSWLTITDTSIFFLPPPFLSPSLSLPYPPPPPPILFLFLAASAMNMKLSPTSSWVFIGERPMGFPGRQTDRPKVPTLFACMASANSTLLLVWAVVDLCLFCCYILVYWIILTVDVYFRLPVSYLCVVFCVCFYSNLLWLCFFYSCYMILLKGWFLLIFDVMAEYVLNWLCLITLALS